MTDNVKLPLYVQTIREYLPHRYPFLLVDRVTGIELGKSITGYKNLTDRKSVV